MRAIFLAVLLALSALPASITSVWGQAAAVDEQRLSDPALEAKARELFKNYRCLVCQNQSIEDSNAGLAKDLRKIVREQVAQGKEKAEISTFLIERYGDWVLLKPPFSMGTLALWFGPFLLLAIALGGIGLALRSRKPREEQETSVLDAIKSRQLDGAARSTRRSSWVIGGGLLIFAIGGSIWTYGKLGTVQMPDLPLDNRLDRALGQTNDAELLARAQAMSLRIAEDPLDHSARLTLAVALFEGGDRDGAEQQLERLDQVETLTDQQRRAVDEGKQALAQVDTQQQPGPNQEDIAAAADMSEEDRQAMIESMVEGLAARLEEEPDDPDGWLRLANAYSVLGKPDEQLNALSRAVDIAPDRRDVLLTHARAVIATSGFAPGQSLPPELIGTLQKLMKVEPTNLQALFFLGLHASQTGDNETAADLWRKALAQVPEDHPLYGELSTRLDAL